jgi:hypothetical protein
MEGEMLNYTKVWLLVFISLCYCYSIGKFVPKGIPRLFGVLPIVCLFLVLPLNLSSIHPGGTFSFFIAWLANFKLLLFAFGKGPLSSGPSVSLGHFLAVACLPIKIQQNPPLKSWEKSQKSQSNGPNKRNPHEKTNPNGKIKENTAPKRPKKGHKSSLNYAIKGLLFGMLVRVYAYSEHIHPKVILCLHCLYIYLFLEIILALVAVLPRALMGLELEPQFDEPYLSASLEDFWGKRWNLMASSILRQTVYEPFIGMATRVIGRKWARLPAIMGTFFVSAIMHELILYYMGCVRITWKMTWFFLLHGLCLVVEIVLKKALHQKFQFPRLISGPLAIGFIMVTGDWLLLPPLLQCKVDIRAFEEYMVVGAFFNDVFRALTF